MVFSSPMLQATEEEKKILCTVKFMFESNLYIHKLLGILYVAVKAQAKRFSFGLREVDEVQRGNRKVDERME